MKVKFLGVDNDTLPEKFYKGKKLLTIDGDGFEYEDFMKFTVAPEAFEFLFNADKYYKDFKVIETVDESPKKENDHSATKGANDYMFAAKRISVAFPTINIIFGFLILLPFGYMGWLNPDMKKDYM